MLIQNNSPKSKEPEGVRTNSLKISAKIIELI